MDYHIDKLVSRLDDCRGLSATAGSATLRKVYHDASRYFERAISCYQKGSYSLARTSACQAYNSINIGKITDRLEKESKARIKKVEYYNDFKPTGFWGFLFSLCKTKK